MVKERNSTWLGVHVRDDRTWSIWRIDQSRVVSLGAGLGLAMGYIDEDDRIIKSTGVLREDLCCLLIESHLNGDL